MPPHSLFIGLSLLCVLLVWSTPYDGPHAHIRHRLRSRRFEIMETLNQSHAAAEISPWDVIDHIYYINLETRPDREMALLQELTRMEAPTEIIQRITAQPGGALGCSQSHLLALRDCFIHGYTVCLILEDDFLFQLSMDALYELFTSLVTLNVHWDVIMWAAFLRHFEPTPFNFLLATTNAQTTSAYMVHRTFLPTLIRNVEKGVALFEQYPHERTAYAIDEYWKPLQSISQWFVFHPSIGYQRNDFSDIEQKVVLYEDRTPIATKPISFFILVKTARHRFSPTTSPLYIQLAMMEKSFPITFLYYQGDPDLPEDYTVDLKTRVVTLRAGDTYIDVCEKTRHVLGFLEQWIVRTQPFSLAGIVFMDDDVRIKNVNTFFETLDEFSETPYWGNCVYVQESISTHWIDKAQSNPALNASLNAYPSLRTYPIRVPQVTFCSGGTFYTSLEALSYLIRSRELLTSLPKTEQEIHSHLSTEGVLEELCAFDDVHIGLIFNLASIPSTFVNVFPFVSWCLAKSVSWRTLIRIGEVLMFVLALKICCVRNAFVKRLCAIFLQFPCDAKRILLALALIGINVRFMLSYFETEYSGKC